MRSRLELAVPAAVVALACIACGRSSQGRPDDELGGLVVAANAPEPVSVDRAATDRAALGRAMATPHHLLAAAIGAHKFTGTSKLTVVEAGDVVEELSDETTLEYAAGGDYHGRMVNSRDYGQEVWFVDGNLYLRPRYGKYHRRPPTQRDEPTRLGDQLFATAGAYFELLAAAAQPTDGGEVTAAGRPARKIAIARAAKAATPRAETAPQRAWRNDVAVRDVSGEVVLDAATGAPLSARFSGTVDFTRDGRTFTMSLEVEHTVSDVGGDVALTAPGEDEWVTTARQSHELDERNQLLEGIAPPARRAPTPDDPEGTGTRPNKP